jgi:hypothetical protein
MARACLVFFEVVAAGTNNPYGIALFAKVVDVAPIIKAKKREGASDFLALKREFRNDSAPF